MTGKCKFKHEIFFRGKEIIEAREAPTEAVHVMATCHALVQLEDEMVGDPLEKATLKAVDYSLTKGRRTGIKF